MAVRSRRANERGLEGRRARGLEGGKEVDRLIGWPVGKDEARDG